MRAKAKDARKRAGRRGRSVKTHREVVPFRIGVRVLVLSFDVPKFDERDVDWMSRRGLECEGEGLDLPVRPLGVLPVTVQAVDLHARRVRELCRPGRDGGRVRSEYLQFRSVGVRLVGRCHSRTSSGLVHFVWSWPFFLRMLTSVSMPAE